MDEIQAPKDIPKVKTKTANVEAIPVDEFVPIIKEEIIAKVNIVKSKKTLSDKQKESLAKGRERLMLKKQQQLKDTNDYKEQMILLKAEKIKQHKKEIKKQVGLPPESSSDSEEEIEQIPIIKKVVKKKKAQRVIYQEEESDDEPVYVKVNSSKIIDSKPILGKLTFY